jgi:membrane protein YqaA with SNARE-associated domain
MDEGLLPPLPTAPRSRNPFRRLYAWILTWAHHPMGTWALAVFAFIDSSVFPIPPLFLQVALSLERPKRAWWYATVDLVGSILGAVVGYLIGALLYDSLGKWVIETWGYQEQFNRFGDFIQAHGFWFTFLYSFLPFPYKVITIGTGFFGGSLPVLLVASSIGRALRFYSLAGICYWKGAAAKGIIDRHFNKVLIGIGLLVAFVIIVMKLWFGAEKAKQVPDSKTGVLEIHSDPAQHSAESCSCRRRRLVALSRRNGDSRRVEVPGEGVEPSWPLSGPGDFKSPASASSATPARACRRVT